MKKNKLTRFISLLLALTFVLTCAPLTAFAENIVTYTSSGTLTFGEEMETTIEGWISDPTFKYYEFTPTESGNYTFYSTDAADSSARLYAKIGTNSLDYDACIVENDDKDDYDYNFCLCASLEAGVTYVLEVTNLVEEEDTFGIMVGDESHGSVAYASDGTLTLDTPFSLTQTDEEDIKFLEFTPTTAGVYLFYSFGDADECVYIYEKIGDGLHAINSIADNDDYNDDNCNFCCWVTLEAGKTYVAKVSTFLYDSASTHVVVTQNGPGDNSYESYGVLTLDEGLDVESSEIIYLEFTPTVSGNYTIFSTGDKDIQVTAFVGLPFSTINYVKPIGYNDDVDGDNLNFSLDLSLVAGTTYVFEISSPISESIDNTITIQKKADTSTFTPDGTLELDKLVKHTDVTSGYCFYYEFTPTETAEYSVYSFGTTDECVFIYEKNADDDYSNDTLAIARNDDYNTYNFKCSKELTAGKTYIIKVRGLTDDYSNFLFGISKGDGSKTPYTKDGTLTLDDSPIEVTYPDGEFVLFYEFTPTESGFYYIRKDYDDYDEEAVLYKTNNDGTFELCSVQRSDDEDGYDFNIGGYFEKDKTYLIEFDSYSYDDETFEVIVEKAPAIEKIELIPSSKSIFVGDETYGEITIYPEDAQWESYEVLSYEIANTNVVGLSETPSYLIGKSVGTTTVVAHVKIDGVTYDSAPVTITVKDNPVLKLGRNNPVIGRTCNSFTPDESCEYIFSTKATDSLFLEVIDSRTGDSIYDTGDHKFSLEKDVKYYVKHGEFSNIDLTITKANDPISEVTFENTSLTLVKDETLSYEYSVLPSTASTASLQFVSENEAIAKAEKEEDGTIRVYAQSVGTTNIVISDGTYTKKIPVTVVDYPIFTVPSDTGVLEVPKENIKYDAFYLKFIPTNTYNNFVDVYMKNSEAQLNGNLYKLIDGEMEYATDPSSTDDILCGGYVNYFMYNSLDVGEAYYLKVNLRGTEPENLSVKISSGDVSTFNFKDDEISVTAGSKFALKYQINSGGSLDRVVYNYGDFVVSQESNNYFIANRNAGSYSTDITAINYMADIFDTITVKVDDMPILDSTPQTFSFDGVRSGVYYQEYDCGDVDEYSEYILTISGAVKPNDVTCITDWAEKHLEPISEKDGVYTYSFETANSDEDYIISVESYEAVDYSISLEKYTTDPTSIYLFTDDNYYVGVPGDLRVKYYGDEDMLSEGTTIVIKNSEGQVVDSSIATFIPVEDVVIFTEPGKYTITATGSTSGISTSRTVNVSDVQEITKINELATIPHNKNGSVTYATFKSDSVNLQENMLCYLAREDSGYSVDIYKIVGLGEWENIAHLYNYDEYKYIGFTIEPGCEYIFKIHTSVSKVTFGLYDYDFINAEKGRLSAKDSYTVSSDYHQIYIYSDLFETDSVEIGIASAQSSNEDVLEIESEYYGTWILCKKAGTATITVTDVNGFVYTKEITVTPRLELNLSKAVNVHSEEFAYFTPEESGYYCFYTGLGNDPTLNLYSDEGSYISGSNLAELDRNTYIGRCKLVQYLEAGQTYNVEVCFYNYNSAKDTIPVYVAKAVKAESISFTDGTKDTIALQAGEQYDLTAKINPINSSDEYISWCSSDDSVVETKYYEGNPYCTLLAKGEGTATIYGYTKSGLLVSKNVVVTENTIKVDVKETVELDEDEYIFFKFEPEESGDYYISTSNNAVLDLMVFNSYGHIIRGYDTNGNGASFLTVDLEKGETYYVYLYSEYAFDGPDTVQIKFKGGITAIKIVSEPDTQYFYLNRTNDFTGLALDIYLSNGEIIRFEPKSQNDTHVEELDIDLDFYNTTDNICRCGYGYDYEIFSDTFNLIAYTNYVEKVELISEAPALEKYNIQTNKAGDIDIDYDPCDYNFRVYYEDGTYVDSNFKEYVEKDGYRDYITIYSTWGDKLGDSIETYVQVGCATMTFKTPVIEENPIEKIEIVEGQNFSNNFRYYYNENSDCYYLYSYDLAGLDFRVCYQDGSTKIYTCERKYANYYLNGKLISIGNYTDSFKDAIKFVLDYCNTTSYCYIPVVSETGIKSIEVTKQPTGNVIYLDDCNIGYSSYDYFDLDLTVENLKGIELLVTYKDGTKKTLKYDDIKNSKDLIVENFTIGNYNVQSEIYYQLWMGTEAKAYFYYQGVEAEYDLIIKAHKSNPVVSVKWLDKVEEFTECYYLDSNDQYYYGSVIITYQDGSTLTKYVPYYIYNELIDFSKVGDVDFILPVEGKRYNLGKITIKHDDSGSWVIDKEATTTEKGQKSLYCVVCGELIATEEIPVLANAKDPFENILVTGCSSDTAEDGSIWFVPVNTQISNDEETWYDCYNNYFENLPAGTYYLRYNGVVKEVVIKSAQAGHSHESKQVVAPEFLKSAATCEAPAVYYYSCECGEINYLRTFAHGEALKHDISCKQIAGDIVYHSCSCSKCDYSVKEEHDYSWKTIKQPTSTSTGTIRYTCKDCGFYYDETVTYEGSLNDLFYGYTDIVRSYGGNRYKTSLATAEALKVAYGVMKFDNIVVVTGTGFADALSASYLATVLHAPIIMVNAASGTDKSNNIEYIKANFNSVGGGKIYIVGGSSAIGDGIDTTLDAAFGTGTCVRLAGSNRYDTNYKVLCECQKITGVSTYDDLIVCTGLDFADALSASALGKPILFVKGTTYGLSENQQSIINSATNVYIIGGTAAVVSDYDSGILTLCGKTVKRIAGANRYEASVAIANEFASEFEGKTALVATGVNYPDGLCGGVLANALGAPLILTKAGKASLAQGAVGSKQVVVLGGESAVSTSLVGEIRSGNISDAVYNK